MLDFNPANLGSNPAVANLLPQPSETEASDDEFVLSWDEPRQSLPQELAYIWHGVVQGERRLDLKSVLGPLPKYKELPEQAPLNNHRSDSSRRADKKERSWQQFCLHGMRILSAAYPSEVSPPPVNPVQLHQQLFQLLAELYQKLELSRKEMSIPGCTPPTGEVLFRGDELKQALQVRRINRFGKGVPHLEANPSSGSMYPSFSGKSDLALASVDLGKAMAAKEEAMAATGLAKAMAAGGQVLRGKANVLPWAHHALPFFPMRG